MAKGLMCPMCNGYTLHLEDGAYKCSNKKCGFWGWGIRDEIINARSGIGVRSSTNFPGNTLQGVYELSKDKYIFALLDMLVLRNKINTKFGQLSS